MHDQPIVVVGDALIDLLREDGEETAFVGGAALNVAVGLAILGHRVQLIAMVGDDEHGRRIRAELDAHGVELIATIGPSGTSVAVSEREDGEPRYSFNEAAWNRRVRIGAAERAALDAASLVVVSCFPYDDHAQADELLAAVRDPRERLLVDPNPRGGMLHDAERFRVGFARAAAEALLVKVGDDDTALLELGALADARAGLHATGSRLVLATDGPRGASVQLEDGEVVAAGIAADPRPIVDTMGAGDACLAAAADAIARRGAPRTAAEGEAMLRTCMAIAAATCRQPGALLRMPTA
ncbi:PfkB family carbohydrate kinase [Clavibacter sp. CFBP 8614]|uniref:PfkB family carbohydrate kinase n=1 Tax=unclassified Clavibacter TaxID=2626594 RepID=UPI004042A841